MRGPPKNHALHMVTIYLLSGKRQADTSISGLFISLSRSLWIARQWTRILLGGFGSFSVPRGPPDLVVTAQKPLPAKGLSHKGTSAGRWNPAAHLARENTGCFSFLARLGLVFADEIVPKRRKNHFFLIFFFIFGRDQNKISEYHETNSPEIRDDQTVVTKMEPFRGRRNPADTKPLRKCNDLLSRTVRGGGIRAASDGVLYPRHF